MGKVTRDTSCHKSHGWEAMPIGMPYLSDFVQCLLPHNGHESLVLTHFW
jgi:hypothetical protein